METKQDLFDEICQLLDFSGLRLGVGSSIPRQFFSEICERMGIPDTGNSVDVSRRIVVSAGLVWPSTADSAGTPSGGGGTVTVEGMQLILQSVILQLDKYDSLLPPDIDLATASKPGEWTLIEGQQTTRSILSARFGVSALNLIASSPWTENLFVFVDPTSNDAGAGMESGVRSLSLRFPLAQVDSSSVSSIADLLNHQSTRQRLRIFEDTFGHVKYSGEFFATNRNLAWSDSKSGSVTINLEKIDIRMVAEGGVSKPPEGPTVKEVLGTDYVPVENLESFRSEPLPFEVDPELLDRALRLHAETQNFAADWLKQYNYRPLSPTSLDPQFDLSWVIQDQVFVAEVKSISHENEVQQFRLGLGQVLDYAQDLDATPVLILSSAPENARLVAIASRAKVILLWPEIMANINPGATRKHHTPPHVQGRSLPK